MLGNFSFFCCQLLTFFIIYFFKKKSFRNTKVWFKIRTHVLTVLIWVFSVCKGHKQMTYVATSKEKVKNGNIFLTSSWKRLLWYSLEAAGWDTSNEYLGLQIWVHNWKLFIYLFIFFPILLNLFFLCPLQFSPQRSGHSLGFICNCKVQKVNKYLSYIKNSLTSLAMRS